VWPPERGGKRGDFECARTALPRWARRGSPLRHHGSRRRRHRERGERVASGRRWRRRRHSSRCGSRAPVGMPESRWRSDGRGQDYRGIPAPGEARHSRRGSRLARGREGRAGASRELLRAIAFPSISTGAYRYPIDKATIIAQTTVRAFLETSPVPERVLFSCFSEADREVYERTAERELAG
jgi:hypothetical protein